MCPLCPWLQLYPVPTTDFFFAILSWMDISLFENLITWRNLALPWDQDVIWFAHCTNTTTFLILSITSFHFLKTKCKCDFFFYFCSQNQYFRKKFMKSKLSKVFVKCGQPCENIAGSIFVIWHHNKQESDLDRKTTGFCLLCYSQSYRLFRLGSLIRPAIYSVLNSCLKEHKDLENWLRQM